MEWIPFIGYCLGLLVITIYHMRRVDKYMQKQEIINEKITEFTTQTTNCFSILLAGPEEKGIKNEQNKN